MSLYLFNYNASDLSKIININKQITSIISFIIFGFITYYIAVFNTPIIVIVIFGLISLLIFSLIINNYYSYRLLEFHNKEFVELINTIYKLKTNIEVLDNTIQSKTRNNVIDDIYKLKLETIYKLYTYNSFKYIHFNKIDLVTKEVYYTCIDPSTGSIKFNLFSKFSDLDLEEVDNATIEELIKQ